MERIEQPNRKQPASPLDPVRLALRWANIAYLLSLQIPFGSMFLNDDLAKEAAGLPFLVGQLISRQRTDNLRNIRHRIERGQQSLQHLLRAKLLDEKDYRTSAELLSRLQAKIDEFVQQPQSSAVG